ncbi:MAG: hypothetical protein AUG49_07475 [Catenulispora sp. 13_1_20CM_3_70_7]|nr:MAG: hypothetical protein AUG49_07475 [Catenulispora sp. 13_1_20CM_3_70_7]
MPDHIADGQAYPAVGQADRLEPVAAGGGLGAGRQVGGGEPDRRQHRHPGREQLVLHGRDHVAGLGVGLFGGGVRVRGGVLAGGAGRRERGGGRLDG